MSRRGDPGCPYEDEGWVGQHWGSQGAGILLTTGSRIFLALRSGAVAEPGVWAVPGGAVPVDCHGRPADPYESALRETEEELWGLPEGLERVGSAVWEAGDGFRYTTFVCRVSEHSAMRFRPTLNWENDDWTWATQEELPFLELHPAFGETLASIYDLVFDVPRPQVRSRLRGSASSRPRGRRSGPRREGVGAALRSLSDEALSAFEEQSRRLGRRSDLAAVRRQRRRRMGVPALDLDSLFEEG